MTAKLSSQIDNLSQLRLISIKPGDVFLGEMEGVDACFSFFFCPHKRKTKQKEKAPAAFFCLLRHFSTLNKKNSLRSNSFLFLTLRKAPPLYGKKKRPECWINVASLVGVGVFIPNFLCLDWGFCLGV